MTDNKLIEHKEEHLVRNTKSTLHKQEDHVYQNTKIYPKILNEKVVY